MVYIDSPYQGLEKATVLQECRVFHDASVVTQNPRMCCLLITKMLFLLVRGELFTSSELTDVFFGVTKLFQSEDVNLRRMTYLFIKEVAETCNPDDVIIVNQSLSRDMTTGEDLYRANSMRVLAKIIDGAMLGAIERYLKQAIVDRNAFVASSALMSGLRLFNSCSDIVKRWVNEVQEAVNSSSDMVQYHALCLLYMIKSHDRLAVSKIVEQLSKGSLRSPLATCLLIRYTSNLLHEQANATNARAAYSFLESCLRHKNEMVIFEAAKTICNLPGVAANEMNPAVTVLQLFISSSKPSLRFAAMRTLSEIATRQPGVVAKCNEDMESLVSDSNRSIATLAITTLLKTGNEGSFDRLLKQITSFMGEIGDELKIVVVKAIREHCVKYPLKHRGMVSFLSTFLREEGGYDFKKAIVDSIVQLMNSIPETKETSLLHLCEFIEDCEFSELIVQILHLIGLHGPDTSAPSRYIRFVFNRIILENSVVRAAAVSTLGSFATRVQELRPSVSVLIKRSLVDEDDEVRDRAALIMKSFEVIPDDNELLFVIDESMPISFTSLERSVTAYIAHSGTSSSGASSLTFATLPIIEETIVAPTPVDTRTCGVKPKKLQTEVLASDSSAEPVDPAAEIYKMPELAYLGRAFRSTQQKALTETEMEYVVHCVKHIFNDHVVLQFQVLNTIDEQRLTNVNMIVEVDDEAYEIEHTLPAAIAKYGEPSNCYVVLKRLSDPTNAEMSCQLTFNVENVDPNTGEIENEGDGYDEEYNVEDLEITTGDFMAKRSLGDFRRSWEQMDTDGEVKEQFALAQFKKLDEAVKAVTELLGMQAMDGTGTIPPGDGSKRTHTLHLSGVFVGGLTVLSRAQLQFDATTGVILKIALRSPSAELSELLLANCISG